VALPQRLARNRHHGGSRCRRKAHDAHRTDVSIGRSAASARRHVAFEWVWPLWLEKIAPTDETQPSALCGIVVIDKPEGMSSFGVVARVRRRARGAKTGHAGTLDPLATGILVLALGRATRSIELLMATDKRYRTEVDLSAFTTTDDCEGKRDEIIVASTPTEADIRAALAAFHGTVLQKPPAFSAIKIAGQRSYRLARAGAPPDIPARPVRIDSVELLRYAWPIAELDIRCGKGTYIRSIARDLGVALGTGGHCRTLRRTAVGPFDETSARSIDALPDPLTQSDLIGLDAALALVESSRSG